MPLPEFNPPLVDDFIREAVENAEAVLVLLDFLAEQQGPDLVVPSERLELKLRNFSLVSQDHESFSNSLCDP